jgi:hypothetical protein
MDKQIYTKELRNALLKVSNTKLKPDIAQKVTEEYVKQLDFTDHALMRVGSTSVAKNLIVHVKSEHFQD